MAKCSTCFHGMLDHDEGGCAVLEARTAEDGSKVEDFCGCTTVGDGLPSWVREQSIEGALECGGRS